MSKKKTTAEQEQKITERQAKFKEAIKHVNSELKKKTKEDEFVNFIPEMKADVTRFSSGSVIVDSVLGGGFPRGRVIEIYGPEASGKTSIALTALGNVQRNGGNCAFIDVEQALDTKYARKLGVDLDALAFSQPSVAEDALGLAITLAETGLVDLIVLDSVAALSPRTEFDDELEKQSVGLLARLMNKALRKLITVCRANDCSIILINQVRDNIGIMYGPKTTTPGGNALKFFASQRLEVKKVSLVKEGDDVIGTEVRIKCIKNKVSAPYGEGVTVLTFNKGINQAAELAVVGIELGVIEQVKQTFFFDYPEPIGEYERNEENNMLKVAVHKKNLIDEIENNEELREILAEKVVEKLEKRNENVGPQA